MKHPHESLKARWQTAEGLEVAKAVFNRLAEGRTLQDLHIGMYDGRTDLRGICAPEVTKRLVSSHGKWEFQQLKGYLEFRNARLESLDFTGSQLKYCRFFDCQISDCCFDNSNCEGWGAWGTDMSRTTFRTANLHDAVLGPWYQGRGNTYTFVDFSGADFRGLVSTTATYIDCDFSNAKLEKIEFQSSSFIRCRFAGELREVIFYDHGFKTGKPDPNPMEDVDFSKAQLRWVAFRRLNLDRVRFPEGTDHLIFNNYPCVLRKALAALQHDEGSYSRGLTAVLGNDLKWIGPSQQIGVLNRLDFREVWGKEGENFAVELLRRAEQECSRPQ